MSLVKQYFDFKAQSYQTKSSQGLWSYVRDLEKKSVFKALELGPGMSCLELGCGAGFYTFHLSSHSPSRLVAVDFSVNMLSNINIPNTLRVCADIQNVGFHMRFDRILCAGALEFLPQISSFLANMQSLLKEKGVMVLLLPKKGLAGQFYKWFHKSHGVNVQLYEPKELSKLLKQHNWIIDNIAAPTPITYVLRVKREGI